MIKRLALLTAALLATTLANGLDLTLADGRVLHDARFVRQDAATVTFRHTGGFSQLEKRKLPPELRAQYPLDEAQARLDAERHTAAALARDAEARRLASERARLAAANPAPAEPPQVEPPPPPPDPPAIAGTDYVPVPWQNGRYYDWYRYHRRHEQRVVTPPAPPPPTPASRMAADVHMTPIFGDNTSPTAPVVAPEDDTEDEPAHRNRRH